MEILSNTFISNNILNILDIIGTIAFALSGAMVAIQKKMDIFGVNILAITTAVGGGIIRDIIIGQVPPQTFLHPKFTGISIFFATLLFAFYYFKKESFFQTSLYEELFFLFDTAGLASFTIDGVIIGKTAYQETAIFFPLFLGVIAGVGGGILRDLFADKTPAIFKNHIYACASIVGALLTSTLWDYIDINIAILVGFLSIVCIRILAKPYRLNLKKIP